jgi:hypothetical protein
MAELQHPSTVPLAAFSRVQQQYLTLSLDCPAKTDCSHGFTAMERASGIDQCVGASSTL